MEWQPIETAQKDGDDVLISGFNYNDESKGRWVGMAAYNQFGVWGQNEFDETGYYQPTHWMPLPEPPQAKEEVMG